MISLIEKLTYLFLLCVGVVHAVGGLLGSLDVIDYYVCMKPVGQCIATKETK
jgi:hypothetical protein